MPLDACLARIEARDRDVRGWAYIDRTAQEGEGPLGGLTVGVKDVIDVAGMPTTYGSPIYAGNIAARDAVCVARLRAAGATILGKTVTAEFATYHPGPTVNPRKAGHTPGGSSSGSAAVVADGQADLALGTQTAGSMIRPASYCGTLGFKPSFARYPTAGVLDTAPHLDTLGLYARTLDMLAAADAVLAGEDEMPAARSVLTIGLCRSPAWPLATPEMQSAFFVFADRLRRAGHAVEDRELPAEFENLPAAQALIHRREAWMEMGHILRAHPDRVSPEFRDMLEQGAAESDQAYAAALDLQRACIALTPRIFQGVSMLLVPGATGTAPVGLTATGDPAFQRIWTALGLPCLGFPAAWTADGLPLGLQIVGSAHADRQLLADARTIMPHAALKETP